jgi:leucyl aminopeptidase
MTTPLSITFSGSRKAKADTAVVFVGKDNHLTPSAADLDKESDGQISAFLKRQKVFTGKRGQTLTLAAANGSSLTRYILVGTESETALTPVEAETIGGKIYAALQCCGAEQAAIHVDDDKTRKSIDSGALAAHIAMGLLLRSYKFDMYRSKKADDTNGDSLKKINLVVKSAAKAEVVFNPLDAVRSGVFLARDLVNLPPNDLYPDSYAKRIKKDLTPLGVTVEIIDEKRMEKMGFGAHLAVGQGSIRPPRVVVMHWNGTGGAKTSKDRPVAFVGKGITFDTGGISIKPSANMDEMKMDMGGSAAVVGAIQALALRKAKANVVGIVALAENMPSDRACRPGDIVTSLAGKTVEILNTDAEGRLVLCDSLAYVQKTYKPRVIIDLATLTGAIVVALGSEFCGSFVNDDDLWAAIDSAGKNVGEKFWRMPLDEAYRKDVESKVADLRNIGSPGKAGSCTAAAFLEAFIEDKTPWAHLDIAGTGMSSAVGGTGFGVRTLERLIADHYEK